MKHAAAKEENPARFQSEHLLRGILLPFPTPFDKDGEVDAAALQFSINKWNDTGVQGYVALGSTGEAVHLDDGERATVIDAARAAVPSALRLLVGTGRQSTRETISETRRAAHLGADAALIVTPHFYRAAMTPLALINHYTAIADAAPIPVVLYNIPKNTGVHLMPETVARLSEHQNIVGIKDSSGDLLNLIGMLRCVPDNFAVVVGTASLLYAALGAGASGGIVAAGCIAPSLTVEIYGAMTADTINYAHANEVQRVLAPLADAVPMRYGISGLKAALDMCGYAGGPVRAPLLPLDEAARQDIMRLLEERELLTSVLETTRQKHHSGAQR